MAATGSTRCDPPCGPEVACRNFGNGSSLCVCPHDASPPTPDGKCPQRRTESLAPRPILHIIPPSHGNSTLANATSTALPTVPPRSHAALAPPAPPPASPSPPAPPPPPPPGAEAALAGVRGASAGVSAGVGVGAGARGVVPPAQRWAEQEWALPAMGVGVAMLLLALAAAVALWRRAHPHSRCFARGAAKPRHGSCSPSPLSLNKGLLEAERYTPNPQYSALAAVGDALPAPALPRARLRLLNELGEGCFGKVFKGELLAAEGGGVMETVAVKVLKDAASAEAEQDFLREVETMSAFRHPNILRLVGVVERDGECRPWMVFEYMPHGDLAEVLRNNSRTLWRPMPGLAPLTQEALLSVARQVAAGMRYLAEQRFVHRDLACRNCLVGAGLVVKIADFGMSRDVYTCDYYKVLGARPLPVRWMSPESIMYGRFTLESDVWSFGVVLWEIYSLGRQPYYGHSNEEVMKLIVQGIMLSCPEGCPAAVREVMRACWKTEPRDRLRFHEVHERLVKAEEEAEAAAAAAAAAAAEAAAVVPTTPPSTSDDTTTPASENALSPTGVESPPSLDDPCRAAGASTSSGAGGLPQPPGRVPLAQLRARAAELLDGENYLLPQQPPPQPREYLQPLPD